MSDSEILKEIEKSTAYRIELQLYQFDLNFEMFERDYNDLKESLNIINDPNNLVRLWGDLSKTDELDSLIIDVTRKLINFLAFLKALVDCNRRVIKNEYKDTPFFGEYQKMVTATFDQSSLVQFLEGLRNFFMHYSLMLVRAHQSLSYDDSQGLLVIENRFLLRKDTLLQWGKWEKGEEYLKSLKDNVDIEEITEKYFSLARQFHNWLISSLRTVHTEELEWLKQKRNELQRKM